jgi:penicillin-binding protein 1A
MAKRILNPRGKKRGKAAYALRFFLLTFAASFILMASFASGAYLYITSTIPQLETLKDYRPNVVSTIYSDDGSIIGEFYIEKRVTVPYSRMPKVLINAFVAAEDGRFFEHKGINLTAIMRATLKNIAAGGVVQGGSTITQQVAKSLLLTPERSLTRKVKEAYLAYKIEKSFSKEDILSLYLNQIYLGEGAYGVEAASMTYFGRHVENITLPEAAMLAGLPRSPARYSPISHFERAKERQVYVLGRMVEDGYITRDEEKKALETKLNIRKKDEINRHLAPYFTEHIRRYISEKYGDDALYKDGLKIYTQLNLKMQEAADKAVTEGLKEVDKRQGYRGPLRRLKPEEVEEYSRLIQERIAKDPLEVGRNVEGVVEKVDPKGRFVSLRIGEKKGRLDLPDMAWAGSNALKPGDVALLKVKGINPKTGEIRVSLDQEPEVQGALVAIDPYTGYVKAMVGGYDFKKTEFNRAVQSRRQPGSAFKPIIYAAALDKGYTPASIIVDSPVIFEDALKDQPWKPKNYDATFYGPTAFRDALVHSRNVVSIKILKDIGVDYLRDYASGLGIRSPLARDLSLALGSSGVSLMELTSAYGVFATQGEKAEPLFITKIVDRDGKVLEESYPVVMSVLSRGSAYIMTSLMEGVVQHGTGQAASALGRPVAGKTGTTNDLSDAWFIGFTPDLAAGVWVGYDQLRPLGPAETGGRAAAPIWTSFMKGAISGTPVKGFTVPEDVVFVKIDKETGLLATPKSRETVFECFKEGTEPTESSNPEALQSSDFFRLEAGGEAVQWAPPKPPEHELE